MKKDVIYVDIEDDITSIIEKVKLSTSKIVALVPPKRIGVLQSVVNLKLLQRAATATDKRVVLITNNLSLSSLAAGVSIPVAKNLQSKPELATVKAPEADDEDIINGNELPIGELASTAPGADPGVSAPSAASTASIDKPATAFSGAAIAAAESSKTVKKSHKIPNFNTFRKKLFVLGGLVLLLAGFSVWALVFAPRGVISITAKTSPYDVKKTISLLPGQALDADEGVLPLVPMEIQKTRTVDFVPTGKKTVGEKATGIITLTNDTESDTVSVPAGSMFTTSTGLQFTSDVAVIVPGAQPPFSGGKSSNPGKKTVAATAVDIGEKYNIGAQSVVSNNIKIDAAFGTATAGGSQREITIVSEEDVAKAKQQLAAQDAAAIKEELKKQFGPDVIVVDESFNSVAGEPSVNPAVGQEAQNAKLTADTKYTMTGVGRDDLDKVLAANINTQLKGQHDQKVYDSGINSVSFNDFVAAPGGYSATVRTTGYVGPTFDTSTLIERAAGKRAGEIQSDIQAIDGVESVDVQLSPFWVTRAPAGDKLTVNFIVEDESR